MAKPNPCPHCGSTDGFVISGQATGPVRAYFGGDGLYLEADFDKMYARYSDTVRCQNCYKIRHDVSFAPHGKALQAQEGMTDGD